MKYTIIYERITEPGFKEGYYYAHIPTLDLTTNGFGIDGAKESARDLVKLWLEEKNQLVKKFGQKTNRWFRLWKLKMINK